MGENLEQFIPDIIKSENADWHVKTHVSKIYKYGDLALKCILPADFIDAGTVGKRRKFLIEELRIGKIYNNGDPENIFKAVIDRKSETGFDEAFLVMEWLPSEIRLDSMLKKSMATVTDITNIATQIFHAHSSINITGEESKYYTGKGFIQRSAVNVELAREGIKKLMDKELAGMASAFEILQTKLFGEIPAGFLEERVDKGYVKFAHADTKSDNIYLRNGRPVILDPVVVKPLWQCADRSEELAALAFSIFECGGAKPASEALQVYETLDKKQTPYMVKFLWLHVANWAFIRAVVSMLHANAQQKECGHVDRAHLDNANLRLGYAIKFAEKALSHLPSFDFN